MELKKFSKNSTALIKGIAVTLLLIHHGLNPAVHTFSLILSDSPAYQDGIVLLSKLCISLFFVMSGYGMYLSYDRQEKKDVKNTLLFVARHILKLFFMMAMVYLLFVPPGELFGRAMADRYAGHFVKYMIFDMTGLASLFGTPLFNTPTWYFSPLLVFYLATPFWYRVVKALSRVKGLPWLLLLGTGVAAAFYPGFQWLLVYFVPYFAGLVAAGSNYFEWAAGLLREKQAGRALKLFLYLAGMGVFLYVRLFLIGGKGIYFQYDWILCLLVIPAAFEYIPEKSFPGRLLTELGEESAHIFLIHGFVQCYYFEKWVYSVKYGVLAVALCLFLCYLLSRLVQKIKEVSHYARLEESILKTDGKTALAFAGWVLMVATALCI